MDKGYGPLRGNHSFRYEELAALLDAARGRTLGQVDRAGVFRRAAGKDKVTGIAGDVIEQSVLGLPADQAQSPDLDVDGVPVELKTIGVRRKREDGRDLYEAKEPATITAVSLDTIAGETFERSKFWHKAKDLLFVIYHYDAPGTVPAGEYARFQILGYAFFRFSPEEVQILRRDWQLIRDFVAGVQAACSPEEARLRYPDLSTRINRETTYLDTAPKYPNPPRFRLRRRVVSAIVQEVLRPDALERLPGRYTGRQDLERRCAQLTARFRGQTIRQILEALDGPGCRDWSSVPKQLAERTVVRMFGGRSNKLSQIGLFRAFGYIGRTVVLSPRGGRTEDMKLLPADLEEIGEYAVLEGDGSQRIKDFQDSDLYAFLQEDRLLCAVFREGPPDGEGRTRLEELRFLGFQILDLASELAPWARRAWETARRTILSGGPAVLPMLDRFGRQRYAPKTGLPMTALGLPKASDGVVFFRGGGKDASDTVEFRGIPMLRQYYWIKGSYLAERLRQGAFLDQGWPPDGIGPGGAEG